MSAQGGEPFGLESSSHYFKLSLTNQHVCPIFFCRLHSFSHAACPAHSNVCFENLRGVEWSCGPHAPSQAETAAGGAAGGGPSPVRQTTVRCGRLGRGREFRCSASSCVHCTSAETPTSTQHCLQPCLKGKDGRGRKRSGQTGSDTVSTGQTRAPYPTPAQ